MSILEMHLRPATPEDALAIAAVAVQVFLDTYATEGVRPDLAAEAFAEYSVEAFSGRLAERGRRFILAEHARGLVGFAELLVTPVSTPGRAVVGAELVRLYVQPNFQRRGIGRRLLQAAELVAMDASLGHLWLTAWEGNDRAHSFYAAHGYQDVGATSYSFQGNSYANRVFVKPVGLASSAA